jgi:hypothetical protein
VPGRSPSEPSLAEVHHGATPARAACSALEAATAPAATVGHADAYHPSALPVPEDVPPRAVLAPSAGTMSTEMRSLLGHLATRGIPVFVGPTLPEADETGAPLSRSLDPRIERIDVGHEARITQRVRGRPAPFTAPAGVELSLHSSEEGPRVLFVIDRANERRAVRIASSETVALVDLLSGERSGPATAHTFELAAHDVRMLEVVRVATTGGQRRVARPRARRSVA